MPLMESGQSWRAPSATRQEILLIALAGTLKTFAVSQIDEPGLLPFTSGLE
jgi:hypothetical protein